MRDASVAALGRCPSGQRERAVNPSAFAYGGSNPPRPTLSHSAHAAPASGRAGRAGKHRAARLTSVAPMSDFCYAERDGHLFVITINRPERMNALHPPGNAAMSDLFDEFQNDEDLWVAIVTGEGDRAFSAGNDLRYQAEGGDRSGMPASGFGGLTSRYDLDKPVIAAVNGVAMGGGFEIALACDIIVASENALFALPEPKVGLAALAGGIHRLPRQIGLKRAMSMMLTGRHVPAAEGQELGFVAETVPAGSGEALACARRWAEMTLACSPMSIKATKQAAMQGLNVAGVQEAHEARYDAVHAMIKSEDYVEGPLAFSEKREPQWKGR